MRARIFSSSKSRMGCELESSCLIHAGTWRVVKVRRFHQLHPVVHHQTAPLRFQLFARFNQLFPLSMDRPKLLLFLARHPHQRERFPVSLHIPVQFQAKRFGIEPVGLHPFVALIEFLRADHVTRDPQRPQLPLQLKAKSARFVDRVGSQLRSSAAVWPPSSETPLW